MFYGITVGFFQFPIQYIVHIFYHYNIGTYICMYARFLYEDGMVTILIPPPPPPPQQL